MALFLRSFTKYMKMKSEIISVYNRHYLGENGVHLSVEYKFSLAIIVSDRWSSLTAGLNHLFWC